MSKEPQLVVSQFTKYIDRVCQTDESFLEDKVDKQESSTPSNNQPVIGTADTD